MTAAAFQSHQGAPLRLTLIGIGTGNPDHVTIQGTRAIAEADLLLVPLKGDEKDDLAALRRHIAATWATGAHIDEFPLPLRAEAGGYLQGVEEWHDSIAAEWARRIGDHLARGGGPRVALMIWGDPSLYDSALRIAERVGRTLPLVVRVVPGVTALQALCAAHAIPLNRVGAPVLVTTGRRLRDEGWPTAADTVVVMLDAGGAFRSVPSEGVHVWWGAFVGMAEEVLIAGPLAEVAGRILRTRAEARAAHGWIMDIYLMRRGADA